MPLGFEVSRHLFDEFEAGVRRGAGVLRERW
jgi:hypothetical protein